jgi:hypothetical protein
MSAKDEQASCIGGYKQLWMLKAYLDELEKEETVAERRKAC